MSIWRGQNPNGERIEKFIRSNAPKGTDEAFTAAELADMNRRRVSKQAFKPYG